MILRTLLAGAVALGLLAAPARAETQRSAITWQKCPAYSDDVLRYLGIQEDDFTRYRGLLARTDCGTLTVPRDYADPRGEQITVALTRLRATDQRRKLGSLAVNPGGPGGSGYLMPHDLVMSGMNLNDRYDLIGFDPRGVGYSTKVDCQGRPGGPPPPGPIQEAWARDAYDDVVAFNRACVASNPGFISQLTAANVARDLDRVRAALGEPKISFLGVSWGTWLGAVYRSLFPSRVHRMWLDSVALPTPRMDVFVEVRAMATDRDFQRLAGWLAERNDVHGFGTTREQVVSALVELRKAYDERPVTFTDLDLTVDGSLVAEAASQPSPGWPLAGRVLKELAGATGPDAPPTVKEVLGGSRPPRPAGAPEGGNSTANTAILCNEDFGPRTFDSAWDAYQRRLERQPVTGKVTAVFSNCVGWPVPPRTTPLRRGDGSLVLSGHLHESPSPYEWTLETQEAIGGKVATVDDDVHGSALRVPGCVAKVVDYFATGRRPGTCPGVPVPESASTGPAAAQRWSSAVQS